MRIIVTGANGFVGRALCRALLATGHAVTGLVRRPGECVAGVDEWVHETADFDGLDAHWPAGLEAGCLIHLAAREHVMHDDAPDPEAAFHASNVDGTLRVARAAHRHGVARVVFLSSIKAVGETDGGVPLTEQAPAQPMDAYGRSKRAAELALIALRDELGLDTVILRPPLVFGPGVRANFLSMLRALSRGLPLPLGAVPARRSLVYVENLADALLHCATDARAAHGLFHVADMPAPSVPAMLRGLGQALGRPARLVPVPLALLRLAATLAGRQAWLERLTSDLRVDAGHLRRTLDWTPPATLDEGFAATARWFRASAGAPRGD